MIFTYIKGICELPALMLPLVTWLRQYLSGFFTLNLLFFPPSFLHCSLQKITLYSLHLLRGAIMFYLLRTECLSQLFAVLPYRRIYSIFFHTIIYLHWYFRNTIKQIAQLLLKYLLERVDHMIYQCSILWWLLFGC